MWTEGIKLMDRGWGPGTPLLNVVNNFFTVFFDEDLTAYTKVCMCVCVGGGGLGVVLLNFRRTTHTPPQQRILYSLQ